MFELIILAASATINLLLGLTVYQKNPRSATSRLFLFLTLSFALWSTVNYISLHPFLFAQIVWVRLVLACAALLCLAVFLTFTVFPSNSMVGSAKIRSGLILYTLCVMLLVMTPAAFAVNHAGNPTPQPGIAFFTLLVIFSLGGGIVNLAKKLRHATGRTKTQLRLVVAGLIVTFGLIFISNFLLVVLFNVHNLISFGPAYTLIFCGTIAYAIIRHRLFDIRAVIARSVGYLLVIGAISLVYSVGLFGVIDVLFPRPYQEFLRQIISVILIAPLVLSFQSVKRFFDRITNRVFYRNYYEPQLVLDALSKVLVHSIDITYLKKQSAKVLADAIKPREITYWLDSEPHSKAPEVAFLRKLFERQRNNLFILDESDEAHDVIQRMRDLDIAVAVHLRINLQTLGYITLSFKESGEPYSDNDKRLLSIAAGEIAISLQNALQFKEIKNFNETLQQKIVEATKELRRSNEKLKELDETKDDFISMASHQLRTPLTSVKGYLSLVLDGDAGPIKATQRELLGQAFISSQRMVYLISDLLNVSRLKTGKFIIEATPVNLADMIVDEIAQLKEAAASRSVELIYNKPTRFPTLMLDETKTRQVIMNFVDNAIYYTPAGGHIRVEVEDKTSTVELRVVDDGIGVPAHEQRHLFTKFYRAGNARKARPDGTGLGLFMAKKVIVAQGGAIIFESHEGKGSTFGFTFRKDKLAPPLQPTLAED